MAWSFGRIAGSYAATCLQICAAVVLAGIVVLMVCDVVGRYLFNHPVPGAAEVIELAMGIVVFSALPLATVRGEHVTLDYFEKLFSGPTEVWVKAAIDLVTAFIIGFLAWRIAIKATTYIRYWDTTPYLQLPIAPVAIFIAVMTAATALVLAVKAVASVAGTGQTN